MPDRNNGGPAFPVFHANAWDGPADSGGMSLRQWYAGQALAGILASFPEDANFATDTAKQALASDSYALADAMLAHEEWEKRDAAGS